MGTGSNEDCKQSFLSETCLSPIFPVFTVIAQTDSETTTDVPVIVFALVILLIAGGMALWTHRRYRPDAPQSERFTRYRFRQRRLAISAMLAIVGAMLLVSATILDLGELPEVFFWFWLSTIGILVWVLILGICDIVAVLRLGVDLEQKPPRRTGD